MIKQLYSFTFAASAPDEHLMKFSGFTVEIVAEQKSCCK
jgi:transketolase